MPAVNATAGAASNHRKQIANPVYRPKAGKSLRRLVAKKPSEWGPAPKPPGFYAFPPEWILKRSGYAAPLFRLLSRRSGYVPVEPYPPPSYLHITPVRDIYDCGNILR